MKFPVSNEIMSILHNQKLYTIRNTKQSETRPDLSHKMNLRQIEAFKVVMENGTITRAAEVMHISQPAMTKLIQAFEKAAGFAAFERSQGRLLPTPEGLLLYRDVDRVFLAAQEIERSARDIQAMHKGALAVGAMPALASGFVQDVARHFVEKNPGIQLDIHTVPRNRLMDMLLSGKLDIALCHSVHDHPEIETEILARHPATCVLPKNHRLVDKREIEAKDLEGEPFISWSEGTLTRIRVDQYFETLGVQRSLRHSASISPALCAFVANGLGIAVMHPLYIGVAGCAVTVKPLRPRLDIELLIAFPRRPSRPKVATAFAALAKSRAEDMTSQLLRGRKKEKAGE